jgi:hypothetical protein
MYALGIPMSSPSPSHLTPQAQQILDELRKAEDWLNRTELAKRVGKSALNKWDIVLLTKLIDSELVETTQVPRHGPIGYEWKYRAVTRRSERSS